MQKNNKKQLVDIYTIGHVDCPETTLKAAITKNLSIKYPVDHLFFESKTDILQDKETLVNGQETPMCRMLTKKDKNR